MCYLNLNRYINIGLLCMCLIGCFRDCRLWYKIEMGLFGLLMGLCIVLIILLCYNK